MQLSEEIIQRRGTSGVDDAIVLSLFFNTRILQSRVTDRLQGALSTPGFVLELL